KSETKIRSEKEMDERERFMNYLVTEIEAGTGTGTKTGIGANANGSGTVTESQKFNTNHSLVVTESCLLISFDGSSSCCLTLHLIGLSHRIKHYCFIFQKLLRCHQLLFELTNGFRIFRSFP